MREDCGNKLKWWRIHKDVYCCNRSSEEESLANSICGLLVVEETRLGVREYDKFGVCVLGGHGTNAAWQADIT